MHTNQPGLGAPWLNPLVISLGLFLFATLSFAAGWPGFRGPNGSGISDGRVQLWERSIQASALAVAGSFGFHTRHGWPKRLRHVFRVRIGFLHARWQGAMAHSTPTVQ